MDTLNWLQVVDSKDIHTVNKDRLFLDLFIKEPWKKKNTKHIDIKDKMISEGSCDTKDWTLVILQQEYRNKLHFILKYDQMENSNFKL